MATRKGATTATEDVVLNKFETNLIASSKTIKANRARAISEDVENAQSEIVRKLTQEKRDLTRKLDSLSDLYPDSELSLRVVKDSFNAAEWASEVQALKVELANKTVELSLAKETYDEWFK